MDLRKEFNWKKFWEIFDRTSRYVSKWDDKRTDQDVFIRRTLAAWFDGRYFQVIFDKYIPEDGIIHTTPAYRLKYTKYFLVGKITFAYSKYQDQILVYYLEPHSTKVEKIWITRNDWHNMKIIEDKESWIILNRFYPMEKNEIKIPVL